MSPDANQPARSRAEDTAGTHADDRPQTPRSDTTLDSGPLPRRMKLAGADHGFAQLVAKPTSEKRRFRDASCRSQSSDTVVSGATPPQAFESRLNHLARVWRRGLLDRSSDRESLLYMPWRSL